MTSPLKQTRDKKKSILKEVNKIAVNILCYPKSSLDRIDMRVLKKLLKKLSDLQ